MRHRGCSGDSHRPISTAISLSIIIFTSNIGSQDIIDLGGADGDQELMKERVTNAMRENVSF